MANGVLIIGPSGSGKSFGMSYLNPAKTVIINTVQKPLSYAKPEGFYYASDPPIRPGAIVENININDIIGIMTAVSVNLPEIQNIVLDDFGYLAVNEYMSRIDEKSFDKFNDIGKMYWGLGRVIPTLRRDLNVFINSHNDVDMDSFGNKMSKFKTVGKLTDKMIVFEGLFAIVLDAKAVHRVGQDTNYVYVTQNDGSSTAKSPFGMFEKEIPNDLQKVSDRILEFYN